ncbi:Tyrosine-protein kinase [Aphelenchoides besseyi]|nr:Tyrosine-protein kinase [Aphelenchoides besseyi]
MTTTTTTAGTTTEGSKEGGFKEFGWKVLPPDVEALNFYFGFLPREAVEALLKNDGNYAVWGRERNDGALWCYILAVQTKTGKVRHLELKLSGREQQWTVEMIKDAEKYRSTTITELVRALAQTSDGISFTDGSEAVKLGQSVKRPESLFCEHKGLSIQDRRLGEGNFCNVVCGWLKSHDGGKKKVAIKAFKEAMPDTPQVQIAKEQKELFMEAKTLSELHHPNIIEFLGIECSRPPIKMVIEFCPGGSLLNHLQKHTMKISVGERLLYLFEVARGMHYLEQKEVIHRDLAARNCLISIDTTIKIADFGLSITKKAAEHERCQKLRVPIRQMAPETIGRQAHFSSKSDVWSYGMFIWEVFTDGQKPWIDAEVKFIAKSIKERKMPTLPAITPREVSEVVASCWERKAEKRPSFGQLANTTSKLVQDSKFALPPIADRTTCRYKLLQPRKIDDFEVEPTAKKSPTSAKSGRQMHTVPKQSPDSARQKTQEPKKIRRRSIVKETSQRSKRDPSPIDPKPKQIDPNGTSRQRINKPSSAE